MGTGRSLDASPGQRRAAAWRSPGRPRTPLPGEAGLTGRLSVARVRTTRRGSLHLALYKETGLSPAHSTVSRRRAEKHQAAGGERKQADSENSAQKWRRRKQVTCISRTCLRGGAGGLASPSGSGMSALLISWTRYAAETESHTSDSQRGSGRLGQHSVHPAAPGPPEESRLKAPKPCRCQRPTGCRCDLLSRGDAAQAEQRAVTPETRTWERRPEIPHLLLISNT